MALAFCAVVAISYGLLRQDWIGGLLAGITIAIALVPEEFPMVLAIFLALGVRAEKSTDRKNGCVFGGIFLPL